MGLVWLMFVCSSIFLGFWSILGLYSFVWSYYNVFRVLFYLVVDLNYLRWGFRCWYKLVACDLLGSIIFLLFLFCSLFFLFGFMKFKSVFCWKKGGIIFLVDVIRRDKFLYFELNDFC